MIIKIDSKLLDKQIRLCDTCAENGINEEDRDLFDGIANLLSEIGYAIENDIEFEIIKIN